jgi:regulation of enolase protein 1 (concanavalin A-like superfamily)
MSFEYFNTPSTSGPSPDGIFTLAVSAPTDIWRKPPQLDVFNAPIVYKSIPIKSFVRARVTISGDWKTLFDQGGLVIVLPPRGGGTQNRWVKAGVEFYEGKPSMSVVAADLWADWSLLPISEDSQRQEEVTVEFEREQEEDGTYGTVLKAYFVEKGGRKIIIREVTWAFHEQNEEDNLWVGVYGARPTKDERGLLVVKLTDFRIETVHTTKSS